MNNLVSKWTGISLIIRIVCGLVIGALLGILIPQITAIGILGSLFVGALKAVAPVLVFFLVMSSLSNASGKIGGRFKTVISLYILSTLLAAAVAVIASYIFPLTFVLADEGVDTVPPEGIGQVLTTLLTNLVQNPFAAIVGANYVGILFWAIVFGVGLKLLSRQTTITVITDVSDLVSKAVGWIIQCAPFGILGLTFQTVSENGLSIFTDYGKLLVLLVGSMLVVALIVNPLIIAICTRKNPYPLVFTCLKESGVTAFFTRSSAANIPVNMSLCEKLGLEKDFYSVSIPLGATINMNGAAVTISVMSLAVAHTLDITVHPVTALLLCLVSALGACGTSGVAGGSLLLIPMACSLFGVGNDIAMQAVAVGFIIGVVQDSVETALNSSGDVMFTAAAEYRERLKNGPAE